MRGHMRSGGGVSPSISCPGTVGSCPLQADTKPFALLLTYHHLRSLPPPPPASALQYQPYPPLLVLSFSPSRSLPLALSLSRSLSRSLARSLSCSPHIPPYLSLSPPPRLEIPPAQMSSLLTIVKRRLTPQPLKIRADVEVTCFTAEGVEAIRYALMEGENMGTEEMPIKIKLIAPPLYVMLTTSLEKEPGIEQLEQCLEFVKGKIEERGGQLTVKVQPRMTSQREELELDQLLEKITAENMEKDGDDDGDE